MIDMNKILLKLANNKKSEFILVVSLLLVGSIMYILIKLQEVRKNQGIAS